MLILDLYDESDPVMSRRRRRDKDEISYTGKKIIHFRQFTRRLHLMCAHVSRSGRDRREPTPRRASRTTV